MTNKYYYKDDSVLDFYNNSKMLHKVDGPAIEREDGSKYWWIDGKLHRVDGPAIEYADGYKYWYINNKLHRVDGPAIEHADGGKEWWINDKELTEEQFDNHPKVAHYRFHILLEQILNNIK